MWVAVRRGTLGRELVDGTLFRSSGRGGRGHRKGYLGHQSVFWAPPESVHFAAARTCGRALRGGWESQSSPGDRQGRSWGPRAIPGRESWDHVGTPGGPRGCTFGSSEHDFRSAGRLGRLRFGLQTPRIQQSCAPSFFSGSAAVAAGHLVSADPGGASACGAL